MKFFFISLIWVIFPYFLQAQADYALQILSYADSIEIDSLVSHLQVLADDSLEGRGTGTEGGNKAAEYIARHLQSYGLQAAGDDTTFFQNIPMHSSLPLPDSRLRLFAPDGIHDFELLDDYLLYKTGAPTFIPNPVSMVFVGYGIIAPEYDYNDYQSIDASGKIVVFLTGEPESHDSTYFAGENPTIYSLPESKQRLAISRGAVGSILIQNPREGDQKKWPKWQKEFAFEDVSLAYSVTSHLSLVMRAESAELLFRGSPYSLQDIFEADRRHIIKSFSMERKLSFRGEFIEKDFMAANVLGLLPGSNPDRQNTYLIITAHYDHLGVGPEVNGDAIYNGAVDNAIGVASVLEMARIFNSMPRAPGRSIIFLFLTGEEKGLLGSRYYLDHPVVPLFRSIANINVDGLAIFDRFKSIVGVGGELSSLGQQLTSVASRMNLSVIPLPRFLRNTETFARSDQIAFAQAGIPAIMVQEGLTYEHLSREAGIKMMMNWMVNYYHTPFDDLNQPLDMEAARQHCRLIFELAASLANSRTIPTWNSGVPYKNVRLQNIAEKR